MDIGALLVALLAALLVAWLWRQGRPAGMAPGPPCVPILGSVFSMTESMFHLQLLKWREKYGDYYSFMIGSEPVVALHGYELIRDALVTHGQQFAGRPSVYSKIDRLRSYTPNFPLLGIADSTMSEEWKRQRSASVQILRSLGYGKHSTEGKIQEEAECLKDVFKSLNGKPFDPAQTLMLSVSNVMCSLLYGERFQHEDKEFRFLLEKVREMMTLFFKDPEGDYIWLYKLKPSYNRMLKDLDKASQALSAFNQKKIDERREWVEKEDFEEPRDFIEGYLRELKPNSKGERKMAEDWLVGILNDFFIAGADTTATTLSWAMILMAARQDIQEKIHQELDREIGKNAVDISLDLRSKCPYIEATIMEIQRFSSIAPIALVHAATTDFEYRGYRIPKDTEVMVNTFSVLHDPKVFPEPNVLKPERFLDEDGKLTRPEQWIPFSMGRRMCLGEQLARQELFMFFTTLMLHFNVKLPEGVTADVEAIQEGALKPKPFQVIFEQRL